MQSVPSCSCGSLTDLAITQDWGPVYHVQCFILMISKYSWKGSSYTIKLTHICHVLLTDLSLAMPMSYIQDQSVKVHGKFSYHQIDRQTENMTYRQTDRPTDRQTDKGIMFWLLTCPLQCPCPMSYIHDQQVQLIV